MAISYYKERNRFVLTTKRTAYAFEILKDCYLLHLYYGKRRYAPEALDYRPGVVSFSPYRGEFGNTCSPDVFPQEISFYGGGDFRIPALRVKGEKGDSVTRFYYSDHRIFRGRRPLDGLPFARADEDTRTLEIVMEDPDYPVTLRLYYTVFYESDVISRYMEIENRGENPVTVEKCMPLHLDLPGCDYEMITLYGGHVWERQLQRVPLHHGSQSICSRRGASSHQYNPFFALCSPKADHEKGDVYGFNFVYSGSFLGEAEVDQMDATRVQLGLGQEDFRYLLEKGEKFLSPEAVMTYSSKGLGRMARNFHAFTTKHILPEGAAAHPHPVVLNTWEACYFRIDEEILLQFAEEAVKLGIDMLVMDDGWFGKRNGDRAGLGDWTPNPEKFKDGLGAFVRRVKEKGIRFGIWIEPEMVNPDSDLYRAHPEWCLRAGYRELSLSREQLVLDMSNPAVLAYLKDSFLETFRGIPIDYFKWDMNRHLCEAGSPTLPPERQGEVTYRYMKGVYELLRFFRETYPDAVIETCSGGGGRYDLGMMAYGNQIWTSDNTNPYARIGIQYSSMLAYPASQMSCHVSNPGESLESLDFRYKVAVGGMLGYELNILRAPEAVKKGIAAQIKTYKTFERLIREGEYFPLISPFEAPVSSYYYASADREQFLLSFLQERDAAAHCKRGRRTFLMKIGEAKPGCVYKDMLTGEKYTGEALRAGISAEVEEKNDCGRLWHLVKQ